jgi:integrase
MALTATTIRNAKPTDKPYKLSDGKGMYLVIGPSGSKLWRLKYRLLGKEKLLALGAYPEVSLKEARDKRDEARKQIATGHDPAETRRIQKSAAIGRAANSFEIVTREWLTKNSAKWVPNHTSKITTRFEKDVFPWIGQRPIAEVTAPELLAVLRRIEARGVIETAHRIYQNCGQIFRYAIATGRAERDVAADLRGALPPVVSKHHASITDPRAVGALLRALQDYKGSFVAKCALRLAPLVFLRPGELRHAEWSEFDLVAAEWRIPASKMKMRSAHIVPLSTQAIKVLGELKPLTGNGSYVFPSVRTSDRPMSENTVNAALRRMGYTSEEMTGHGFRSMASTLLNEHGWNRDAIERQLAHAERNNVRAAYNFAEFLVERREMMQWWANHLDSLAAGGKVIPLHRSRGKTV